jgi:hypothetical protein
MILQKPEFNPNRSKEILDSDYQFLNIFIQLASTADISWQLDFDTGRYVEGKDLISQNGNFLSPEDILREKIIQDKQGFRIEVGSYENLDNDGFGILYETLGEAANAGLNLLYHVISEKQGEAVAKKIFRRYFKKI